MWVALFFGAKKRANTCLLIGTVLVGALGAPACDAGHAASPPAAAAPLAVRVTPARSKALREVARYIGSVRAAREIDLVARLPGTLTALPIPEGGRAAAGEPLAIIATPDLEARQARLRAELRRASSDRAYLCGVARTDRELVDAGALEGARRDASVRACRSSEAAVEASRAAIAELEATLEKRVDPAPFDGRVLDRLAEPGANVAPGRPLLRFGSDALEIEVRVTESDVRRGVDEGTAALVQLDGATWRTRVLTVAPSAVGPGRTLEVRVALPPEAVDRVRHGMSVEVAFVLREAPEDVAVPLEAVRQDAAGHHVFVVRDAVVHAVAITPGASSDGWVSTGGALPSGADVVVGELGLLEDGLTVYPVAVSPRTAGGLQ